VPGKHHTRFGLSIQLIWINWLSGISIGLINYLKLIFSKLNKRFT
jgi:hypothetical protein